MAHWKLSLVKEDLRRSLNRFEQLAIVASGWNRAGIIPGVPRFTNNHVEMVVSLAFLSGFLAWEKFLEESFIIYLMGKSAPNGYKPIRHVTPRNREHASEFCKGDKSFARWDDSGFVVSRSKQFFLEGKPFVNPILSERNSLENMKTIRNAIAHQSTESQEKFENLVRRELGYLPNGTNIGNFLLTNKAGVIPPTSYLEFYFDTLSTTASAIVP